MPETVSVKDLRINSTKLLENLKETTKKQEKGFNFTKVNNYNSNIGNRFKNQRGSQPIFSTNSLKIDEKKAENL